MSELQIKSIRLAISALEHESHLFEAGNAAYLMGDRTAETEKCNQLYVEHCQAIMSLTKMLKALKRDAKRGN
jgi:hypothetical protein